MRFIITVVGLLTIYYIFKISKKDKGQELSYIREIKKYKKNMDILDEDYMETLSDYKTLEELKQANKKLEEVIKQHEL